MQNLTLHRYKLKNHLNDRDTEIKEFVLKREDCYSPQISQYVWFLDTYKLEFNFDNFKTYLGLLKEGDKSKHIKKVKPSTYNRYCLGIKKRIRELFEHSWREMDLIKTYCLDKILKEIKLMKVRVSPVPKKHKVTIEEHNQLMESDLLPDDSKLIIQGLFETACRAQELLNIQHDDMVRIKQENEEYYEIEVIGKGNNPRTVYMEVETYNKICKYFKGKKYLFVKPGTQERYKPAQVSMKVLRKTEKILGPDHKHSLHNWRHGWADRKHKEGLDPLLIQQYLGHQSLNTTTAFYIDAMITPSQALRKIR